MSQATIEASHTDLLELGRKLPAGEVHEITRLGNTVVYLVRAVPQDSGFDTHESQDELVVVLDGLFPVELPGGITHVQAGQSLLIRQGTPHRTKLASEAIVLLIR
jgi:mannose-6-phosphate isomerase-like protein (cupin superfamily)